MPVEPVVVVPFFLGEVDITTHLNLTNLDGSERDLVRSKLVAATDWIATYAGIKIEMCASDDEEDERPDVPPRVREAILMLAAHLYNNRESVLVGVTAQELPFGILDLLADYRGWCA